LFTAFVGIDEGKKQGADEVVLNFLFEIQNDD
jgi:hypothetical protein